jgi:hypothetical protein
MPQDWLERIFDFPVERREIFRENRRPYFVNTHTQIGVLHTTEAPTIERSWQALNGHHSAPHFLVGEGRIVQCRPLTVQGSALRGGAPCHANAQAAVQIEMVGYTGGGSDSRTTERAWIPGDEVLLPTVAVMAYCAGNEIDIPLQVPNEAWLDDCSDMPLPWAAGPTPRRPNARMNARRTAAAAGGFPRWKGWWMHVEVPCQGPTWHHDCGRLRRTEMLSMARELLNA